ncbi:MAG: prepilin-type N-terminal cleavage/methylation domain-containing protein [Planctomycetales bacterium]
MGHRGADAAPLAGRGGFTLVELMMAMTITAILAVILSGIVSAVHTAHAHTNGIEDATLQAQGTLDRIEYMVAHAGTYRVGGNPSVVGIAVVTHQWAIHELPDVLVVWSGGRSGGMAAAGEQTRLPRANELVVYAPDPADPARFLEFAFPNNTANVDFQASGFRSQILSLLSSSQAEGVLLCDRVRRAQLPQFGSYAAVAAPNVRFDLGLTPSDSQVESAAPGTSAWNALPWAQGIVAGDSGLRQASVRIELMIEPRERPLPGTESLAVAIPFFGSASHRHVYRR